jgi:hypothetical protein
MSIIELLGDWLGSLIEKDFTVETNSLVDCWLFSLIVAIQMSANCSVDWVRATNIKEDKILFAEQLRVDDLDLVDEFEVGSLVISYLLWEANSHNDYSLLGLHWDLGIVKHSKVVLFRTQKVSFIL